MNVFIHLFRTASLITAFFIYVVACKYRVWIEFPDVFGGILHILAMPLPTPSFTQGALCTIPIQKKALGPIPIQKDLSCICLFKQVVQLIKQLDKEEKEREEKEKEDV